MKVDPENLVRGEDGPKGDPGDVGDRGMRGKCFSVLLFKNFIV